MKRKSNSKNMAAALLVVARKIDAVDEVQRSIKLVLELLKKVLKSTIKWGYFKKQ